MTNPTDKKVINEPKTAEQWQLELCLRTIKWCKDNEIEYPGDIVMVPAFNVMKLYAQQEGRELVEALEPFAKLYKGEYQKHYCACHLRYLENCEYSKAYKAISSWKARNQ